MKRVNSTFGASYPGVEGGLPAASTHGRVALSGHPCVIEPFDPARDDRTGFSCCVAAVDNYFKKTANKLAKAGNVRLLVMLGADPALIGFYAMNAHADRYQDLPARFPRARPGHGSIPAAFTAMIGRDQRYSGAGFGADLMVDALRRSIRRRILLASPLCCCMCWIAATPNARQGARRSTRAMAFNPCHLT